MSMEHLRDVRFWIGIALVLAQSLVPAFAEWSHISSMAAASLTTGLTIAIGKLALDLPTKEDADERRALRLAQRVDSPPAS